MPIQPYINPHINSYILSTILQDRVLEVVGVKSINLNNAGTMIAVLDNTGNISLWNVKNAQQLISSLGINEKAYFVGFFSDDKSIIVQ